MKKLQDELLLNKVRRGLEERAWGPRTRDMERALLGGGISQARRGYSSGTGWILT